MKEIPLTKGMSAIVDDDDFEWLNQQKWFCSVAGSAKYAARESPRPNRKPIYMHREIMKTPEGMETDHINHNGLDNRKDNLRNCSHVDNEHNKGITRRNKSGYKGVSFYKKTGKWHAEIMHSGMDEKLGEFLFKEDAARAYDLAAIKHHGRFAFTNFNHGELKQE